MEPRIQYAKTSDGVNIAFWTLGEGEPLVFMPALPHSHIQLEWQVPEWRLWFERIAERRKLIRYDPRGSGLSERDVTDFSLDSQVLDLQAVADRLGLENIAILAALSAGPVAIAYAARHPERVSRLILWCSQARVSRSPRFESIRALLDSDWELFTETASHFVFGWSSGEESHRFAVFIRECITPEAYRAALRAADEFDVTTLLPQVRPPTLVLHRRQIPWHPVDVARSLASQIPDARLVVLEGTSIAVWVDMEPVLAAIDEFLGEGEAPAVTAPDLPSGTTVILFADIVDSTALTERLGDAAFRGKARGLDGALRAVIREHSGTPIEGKLLGDGVLAVFTSAWEAIAAALACGKAGEEAGLPLHLGIHAGDVIREEGNVYGGAVNIAARISALSAPGEVLVSETVRGLARTSAGVTFEDRGEHTLKGVSEPVRAWAVREGEGP